MHNFIKRTRQLLHDDFQRLVIPKDEPVQRNDVGMTKLKVCKYFKKTGFMFSGDTSDLSVLTATDEPSHLRISAPNEAKKYLTNF
eukprot:m.28051 g.28051  ORF g.28051 m.28051 type:complete len:85 (+) comp30540_c0_seq1:440-694(+)